ncbi:DUF4142 domain-containing protein [Aureliella helgolandensis]|uniref:DUF4142 domain-containing protein n=1 Tax=Aureliella helgolandensis TaxID=2527968 RepID=A0A518GB69_9BACT|nr:DUF4142 domain-containing protein [Aureliella helgolandensis]QDV25834.1 hypothetical protein Q31a_41620 [Aureliella helgolandensis]
MSKLRFSTAALTIAAISGFSIANAQTPVQPGQPIVQPGQPTTTPGQPLDAPLDAQNQRGDRYESRRASNDSQQQGPTVKEALVQKLIKSNEAEIELAKLAQQKSDNQEVKQFTQTLIQDHQSLNQTLQKHAATSQSGQARSVQAGTARGDQPRTAENRTANSGAGNDRAANDRRSENRMTNSQSNRVPKELCEIGEQACENALKMTKEMLNGYEGQDFNMAYLGQQCVMHTMMLAELKAIESSGLQELQEIAQQASAKVQQHLDKAKQIAKKLEDDSKARS